MIIIRLDEIRKEHRFSIMMIHEETGISRSTLTEMSYGRIKRIDLDTLDRLCTFFNKYIPGFKLTDLINYISD